MLQTLVYTATSCVSAFHLLWPQLGHPWLWIVANVLFLASATLMFRNSWKSGLLKLSFAELHRHQPRMSPLELLAVALGIITVIRGPA
jgi:hypothetical protein